MISNDEDFFFLLAYLPVYLCFVSCFLTGGYLNISVAMDNVHYDQRLLGRDRQERGGHTDFWVT